MLGTVHPSVSHFRTIHPAESHFRTLHPSESHFRTIHQPESHFRTIHPSESHFRTIHPPESHFRTIHPPESHFRTIQPSESHFRTIQPSESHFRRLQQNCWKPHNIRGSNVLVKPDTCIFNIMSHPDNYLNICHHTNLKAWRRATHELLFMEQAYRLLQSSNVWLTNHLSTGFSMSLSKVNKLEGRNWIWVFTTLCGAKSPAVEIKHYSSYRNWSKQYSEVPT
jgi:hypothetical protein